MSNKLLGRGWCPLRVLLLVLLLCGVSGCKEDLYSKLTEIETNEMLAVLADQGIVASKVYVAEDQTWRLEVESGQFAAAVRVLNGRGLPHTKYESLGKVFKKDSLVSTPNEERIRYIYALSQELSNTLSQIDGVIVARVQPVLPSNDPLAEKVTPASASVFIKHRSGVDLRSLAPAIKGHVMASIEGLEYDRISLSFFPAETVAAEPVRSAGTDSAMTVDRVLLITLAIAAAASGALLLAWRYRASWLRGVQAASARLRRRGG
jgi:type III secretion protein J